MSQTRPGPGPRDKTSRLGRGFSALLPQAGAAAAPAPASGARGDGVASIPIEDILPDRSQPRRHFDETRILELANSIRSKGVIQPVLVRRDGDKYRLIAGERRWRAAQKAGLHKVPVVIRDADDAEALEVAIIENIQRADLSPVEEALAYERLMKEFGHTQEQLGQIVGKSRSHVANLLRLLTLPPPVQEMLNDGRLTMGHARALVTAANPLALAQQIVRENLTVREVEDLAREQKPGAAKPGAKRNASSAAKDPDIAALEADLSEAVGYKVVIEDNGKGGGELRIAYKTLDQLDELCRRLCQR